MNRVAGYALVGVGGMLLTGLVVWRVGEALTRRSAAAEASEVTAGVPVDVLALQPRDLVDEVRVAGTLRALHEADVVADVPGRVEAVLAEVGASVTKGQPLARLESRELSLQVDQARAGLSAASAGKDAADRDLAGALSVAEVGGVTEAQLVAAKSRAASAAAQVDSAKAALGLASERLGDAVIRAPFDGVVVRRGTDIGRLVSPGAPAFGVADLSELELVVGVDERVAAHLNPGDRVGIQADAAVEAPPEGVVKTVSPMLDPSSHKAEVIIGLASAPGLYGHGGATATFRLGSAAGALAVPSGAIVDDHGDQVVYVVDGDLARRTVVHPGLRDGDWVQVDRLGAGARVVVNGNTFLSDGARVVVRAQERS